MSILHDPALRVNPDRAESEGSSFADDLLDAITDAGPREEPTEQDREWYSRMAARLVALEEELEREARWQDYERWAEARDHTIQCFADELPSGGSFGHQANEREG